LTAAYFYLEQMSIKINNGYKIAKYGFVTEILRALVLNLRIILKWKLDWIKLAQDRVY
jgi:hypothetical protein